MKNPHGVEPTRFMKRKESEYAIGCYPKYGPVFRGNDGTGLYIFNNCNTNHSWTYTNGTEGYECHPVYKSSLFVNTNDPDKSNHFIVSDYEVFAYN